MKTARQTFAVLGLSQFGFRAAAGLFAGGMSVVAVDKDEHVVQRASSLCTKAVCADAIDFEVMAHLGVFDVDTVVIGLRKSFEASVLLAHHLSTATSVKRVIAQVDTDAKALALKRLGVHQVVFPERDSADRLVQRLTLPDIIERIPLTSTTAIVELRCPPTFAGKTIGDLQIRKRHGVYVVGIKSAPAAEAEAELNIAPPPDTAFRADDTLLLLGRSEALQRLALDVRSS